MNSKKLRRTSKKCLALFLSLLMIMTTWVFAAPSASATGSGTYDVRVVVSCTDSTKYSRYDDAPPSYNDMLGTDGQPTSRYRDNDKLNRAGFTLYYNEENGTGDRKWVARDFTDLLCEDKTGFSDPDGDHNDQLATDSRFADDTNIVTRTPNVPFEVTNQPGKDYSKEVFEFTLPGFPTGVYVANDRAFLAFGASCGGVSSIWVKNKTNNTWVPIFKGYVAGDSTVYFKDAYYGIRTDGTGIVDKTNPKGTGDCYHDALSGFEMKASNFPGAVSYSCSWDDASAVTLPGVGENPVTRNLIFNYATDQYGVQLDNKFTPRFGMLGTNISHDASNLAQNPHPYTFYDTANLSGQGQNTQTATATLTVNDTLGTSVTKNYNLTLNDHPYTVHYNNVRNADGTVNQNVTKQVLHGDLAGASPIAPQRYKDGTPGSASFGHWMNPNGWEGADPTASEGIITEDDKTFTVHYDQGNTDPADYAEWNALVAEYREIQQQGLNGVPFSQLNAQRVQNVNNIIANTRIDYCDLEQSLLDAQSAALRAAINKLAPNAYDILVYDANGHLTNIFTNVMFGKTIDESVGTYDFSNVNMQKDYEALGHYPLATGWTVKTTNSNGVVTTNNYTSLAQMQASTVGGKVEIRPKVPTIVNHTPQTQTIDATCTVEGYTVSVCTVCGYKSGNTTGLNPNNHKYQLVSINDSSCATNTDGTARWICEWCHQAKPNTADVTTKAYHSWTVMGQNGAYSQDTTTAQVFDNCGVAEHPTDCHYHVKCATCGKEGTLTAPHNFTTTTKPFTKCGEAYGYTVKTCTRCGEVENDFTGARVDEHNFKIDLSQSTNSRIHVVCQACGEAFDFDLPDGEHLSDKLLGGDTRVEVTQAPTCNATGTANLYYSYEGVEDTAHPVTITIPRIPTAHKWDYTTETTSTYTDANGVSHKCYCEGTVTINATCAHCGATRVVGEVNGVGHRFPDVQYTDPTCHSDAYWDFGQCIRCGKNAYDCKDIDLNDFIKLSDDTPLNQQQNLVWQTDANGNMTNKLVLVDSRLRHNFDWSAIKPLDCTVETTATCIDCHQNIQVKAANANHNWYPSNDTDENHVKIVEPTCDEDGYYRICCQDCQTVLSGVIPRRAEVVIRQNQKHVGQDIQFECQDATYTEDVYGYTAGSFNIVDNTTTGNGAVYATLTWPDTDCPGGKTVCTNFSTTPHDWQADGPEYFDFVDKQNFEHFKQDFTCQICGDTKSVYRTGAQHNHTWATTLDGKTNQDANGYIEINEATCTNEGLWARYCTVCKRFETRKSDALGHNWGNQQVVSAATCESYGVLSETCQNANCPLGPNATRYIKGAAPLGHSWPAYNTDGTDNHGLANVQVTAEATCDTAEKLELSCTRAGCTHKKQVIGNPATGHIWNEIYDSKSATHHYCTDDMFKLLQCTECDLVKRVSYAPAGFVNHNLVYDKTIIDASELESSQDLYKCTNTCPDGSPCEYTEIRSDTPAIGAGTHVWSTDGMIIRFATCTEPGFVLKTCTEPGCAATMRDFDPAINIAHGNYVRNPLNWNEAVLDENGNQIAATSALGHHYSDKISYKAPTCLEDGGYYQECDRQLYANSYFVDDGGKLQPSFKVCGDKHFVTNEPALGHDWTEWRFVPCDANGNVISNYDQSQFGSVAKWKHIRTCKRDGCTAEQVEYVNGQFARGIQWYLGVQFVNPYGADGIDRVDTSSADYTERIYTDAPFDATTNPSGTKYYDAVLQTKYFKMDATNTATVSELYTGDTPYRFATVEFGKYNFTGFNEQKNAGSDQALSSINKCTVLYAQFAPVEINHRVVVYLTEGLTGGKTATFNVKHGQTIFDAYVNEYYPARTAEDLAQARSELINSVLVAECGNDQGAYRTEFKSWCIPGEGTPKTMGDTAELIARPIYSDRFVAPSTKAVGKVFKGIFYDRLGHEIGQLVFRAGDQIKDLYRIDVDLLHSVADMGPEYQYDQYKSMSYATLIKKLEKDNSDLFGEYKFTGNWLMKTKEDETVGSCTSESLQFGETTIPYSRYSEYQIGATAQETIAMERDQSKTDMEKGIVRFYADYYEHPYTYYFAFDVNDTDGFYCPGATVTVLNSSGFQAGKIITGDSESRVVLPLKYDEGGYTVYISFHGLQMEFNITPDQFTKANRSYADQALDLGVKKLQVGDILHPDAGHCKCICHSFLGRFLVSFYNIIYSLSGKKIVCCPDMFDVHAARLHYGK